MLWAPPHQKGSPKIPWLCVSSKHGTTHLGTFHSHPYEFTRHVCTYLASTSLELAPFPFWLYYIQVCTSYTHVHSHYLTFLFMNTHAFMLHVHPELFCTSTYCTIWSTFLATVHNKLVIYQRTSAYRSTVSNLVHVRSKAPVWQRHLLEHSLPGCGLGSSCSRVVSSVSPGEVTAWKVALRYILG